VVEGHHDREQALSRLISQRINPEMVGALLGKAANSSADRISAGIIEVFREWDQQRIAQAGTRLGHHPELWKTAKGVVLPKPGKPDCSKVRAYRVISLLDIISKAHLGRRIEAEELGVGNEEQSLFLPTPSFMALVEEE
jgi:hypothetical protein